MKYLKLGSALISLSLVPFATAIPVSAGAATAPFGSSGSTAPISGGYLSSTPAPQTTYEVLVQTTPSSPAGGYLTAGSTVLAPSSLLEYQVSPGVTAGMLFNGTLDSSVIDTPWYQAWAASVARQSQQAQYGAISVPDVGNLLWPLTATLGALALAHHRTRGRKRII